MPLKNPALNRILYLIRPNVRRPFVLLFTSELPPEPPRRISITIRRAAKFVGVDFKGFPVNCWVGDKVLGSEMTAMVRLHWSPGGSTAALQPNLLNIFVS